MTEHRAGNPVGALARSAVIPPIRHLRRSLLLLGLLVVASAMANIGQAAEPARRVAADTNDRVIETLHCPGALFKIMPGAFDYCVGVRRWGRGYYGASVDMFKSAAAWGNKDAQLALGIAYFNGDHVPANRPLGLAWLGLAAERKETGPLQLLASAYAKATPTERQQAQVLMDSLWPVYADANAAVKADTYYQRAIRRISERAVYGDGICIAGVTASPMPGMSGDGGTVSCPTITQVVKKLDLIYAGTMRGWRSQVTVGDLKQVDDTDGADGRLHKP